MPWVSVPPPDLSELIPKSMSLAAERAAATYQLALNQPISSRTLIRQIFHDAQKLFMDDSAIAEQVTSWVQRSLGIPSRNLDPSESFEVFYEVHVVNRNDFDGQFKALQNYQLRVVKDISLSSHVQRNPLVRYLNDTGYDSHGSDSGLSESEDSDSDHDYVESDSDDSVESESMDLDGSSPGEKDTDVSVVVRLGGPSPQPGLRDRVLPVSQHSSGLPIAKLKGWHSILQDVLINGHSTKSSEEDALLKLQDERVKIADVINQMRQVHVLNQHHKVWKSAVQKSGLASLLEQISSPDFLPRSDNPHSEYLFRCFRLQEALGAILSKWTPRDIAESWEEDEERFQPHPLGSMIPLHGFIKNSARLLMGAMKKFPVLVPGMANPSSIFFLVSLDCFLLSWHQWLGRSLEHLGFSTFETDPATLFTNIKSYLSQNEGKLVFDDARLHAIVHRTRELDVEKENYNCWLHQNQPGSRDKGKGHKTVKATETTQTATEPKKTKKTKKRRRARAPKVTDFASLLACIKCKDLSENKKCVQMLEIKRQNIAEADIVGHGISLADPEDCMVPRDTTTNQSHSSKKTKKPTPSPPSVHSPSEFGMQLIECDPHIVKRCQGLTYLLVEKVSIELLTEAEESIPSINHNDGSMEEDVEDTFYLVRDSRGSTLYHLIDFVRYNAFDEKTFEKMKERVTRIAHLKPLKRGKMFDSFVKGDMTGTGSRQPSGGARADTYRPYATLDSTSPAGIHTWFDIAMDDMYLREGARHADPALVKTMDLQTNEADRLGMTGTNLFYCSNYCAPIHPDHDVGRGICSQVEWDADARISAYSFCQPNWGYYIVTQPNMIWSFDSSDLHGTMLPSRHPWEREINDLVPDMVDHSSSGAVMCSQIRVQVNLGTGISTGTHKTAPLRNIRKAREYARVRRAYRSRSEYWRS